MPDKSNFLNASHSIYSTVSSTNHTQEFLTCRQLIDHVTIMLQDDVTDEKNPPGNSTGWEFYHEIISTVASFYISPLICSFGIFGNVLNLIVLTKKRLQCSMDHMEISAHIGLVALAFSDLFFCIFFLLSILVPERPLCMPDDWKLGLYLNVYKDPLVNIFVLSSTWLTVVTAVGRYTAVCRPLHARGLISISATYVAVVAVFFLSALFNLPKFFYHYPFGVSCKSLLIGTEYYDISPDENECQCSIYHRQMGSLSLRPSFIFWYGLAWNLVGILFPLIILTICNVCLILALRRSYRLQKMHRANMPKEGGGGHKLTTTLIIIIIMFIVCVGPSGVMTFLSQYVLQKNTADSSYANFSTALEITNCLLLINYAMNFVLYCLINVQFRRIAVDVITCSCMIRRRALTREGTSMEMTLPKRRIGNTLAYNLSVTETDL